MMIPLNIPDLETLQASYLHFVDGGAIFCPSPLDVNLGDEKLIMLSYPGLSRGPVTGKVVWINPKQTGVRPKGFAITLSGSPKGMEFKTEFERLLAGRTGLNKSGYTM